MKRDMDLVRRILLKIEEHEHGLPPRDLNIDGYSAEQIGYHVYLMGQGGLLKVANGTHFGSASPEAIPLGMLWAGHDFLDAAREQSTWDKAKAKIADAGASVTFELLKAVLVEISKKALGLP